MSTARPKKRNPKKRIKRTPRVVISKPASPNQTQKIFGITAKQRKRIEELVEDALS